MIIENIEFITETIGHYDSNEEIQFVAAVTVYFKLDVFKGTVNPHYDNVSQLTLEEIRELVYEEAVNKMEKHIELRNKRMQRKE